MTTGIVKWFNPRKGFGFIAPDEGGTDIFVHISAVHHGGLKTLEAGEHLSYEIATERGKPVAVNVKPLQTQAAA